MNKPLVLFLTTLVLLPFQVLGQEQMTPARFRKIVSTPGDSTPLIPELSAAGPLWTNATVSISLKYESGKTFKEEVAATAKTVEGKYVVTTVRSPSERSALRRRATRQLRGCSQRLANTSVWPLSLAE
jgi:hypothetical protein